MLYQDDCILMEYIPDTCSSGNHVYGQACEYDEDDGNPNTNPPPNSGEIIVTEFTCNPSGGPSGGGAPSNGGTPPPYNPGNGHGNGSTGGNTSSPTTSCKGKCVPIGDIDFECTGTEPFNGPSANLNLSAEEVCFLLNNLLLKDQLDTYLEENGNDEFAEAAVEAWLLDGEVDWDEELILDSDLKNNTCLNSVYIEMGKAPTFANYLSNFDSDMSVANLKLTSNTNLISGTNAQTSPPQNYLITITFNENNLDRPNLSIARTFIHEIIHAEVFRKLLSAANQPNLNYTQYTEEQWRNYIINLRNNFEGLYDYYMRWKWDVPHDQTPSDPQHEAMAQHYRDIVIQALMEYDPNQTNDVYEALAWEGLMGSGTFNATTGLYSNSTVAWSNLSQQERLNTLSVINTFKSSNPNCQ
ncbi:hypothetical protein [Bizionia echini]|uniref:hypothetical protein n=1 Tax=Bizionia echini TaxID=649333 RepID=UPI001160A8E1|nr:hypothetical protein [Bizionia echini]